MRMARGNLIYDPCPPKSRENADTYRNIKFMTEFRQNFISVFNFEKGDRERNARLSDSGF